MTVVGLTGGIGSGKTTVAKAFNTFGIPIYIADDEAKKLMNRSKVIRRKLIALFGENAYKNDELNRPFIASVIYSDKEYLRKMNAIVHPKVAKHFIRWLNKQTAPYVLKESAILFETNSYKACNFIVLVTAPIDLKIKRLLVRDNSTKEKILAIMENQLSDDVKAKSSDYVINNITLDDTHKQVSVIHKNLLKKLE